MPSRAGFVSIVGRPNAGKSTLLNALLGEKLAIVARRPQTTRTTVQGVLNLGNVQMVFLDTPGIHKSDTLFNQTMMKTVRMAVEDRDLLLFLADATQHPGKEEIEALSLVAKSAAPVFLVLNKIDLLADKAMLLQRIEEYKAIQEFAEYVPISASRNDGVNELTKLIAARMPASEPFYPADYLTDQPERYRIAELIREKILHFTSQEVPHSVAVLVEKWDETPKITRILATIYVERDGQKRIVIGAGGSVLKKIGTSARIEAEKLLDTKVFGALRCTWHSTAKPRYHAGYFKPGWQQKAG